MSSVATPPVRGTCPALVELLDRYAAPDRLRELVGAAVEGVPPGLWEQALLGPARRMLARPGKQVRARLVEAGWALGGGDPAAMPPDLPFVVELLHTGSLIIDDIEDGSRTRRGGPALHVEVGTPVALNTGNWLYFLPFAILEALELPQPLVRDLCGRVTRALLRCHHGQALDLTCRVHELGREDLVAVVRSTTELKTGSLAELAVALGAAAAGGSPGRIEAAGALGAGLGVGLQMLDDLSSVTRPDRLDKGLEDARQARPTWPWAWLVLSRPRPAHVRLRRLQRAVADGRMDARVVVAALRHEIGEIGRRRATHHLDATLQSAQDRIGDHPALATLSAEAHRLTESF